MDEERGHKSQLLICHERILGNKRPRAYAAPVATHCNLAAYAWCYDCDYYVCDIHMVARHEGHDTVIEYPDKTFRPGSEFFLRSARPRPDF